ncbi:MAG: energy-coupling factor transporter transmembrane protein EcfT [Haloferacaceae archaeon]
MSAASGLYVDRESFFHSLDPRATLALVVALFVPAYTFGDPRWVAVPLAVGFAALLYAGGWRNFLRLRFIVFALFVVGLVVWPSFTEAGGPTILDLGFYSVTRREFLFALGRSMRIASFIVGGLVFVTTTSNEEIVRGMRELGLPYAFCFAVGTALRLFPTFLGAAGTVRQAQEARGLDLSASNPVERLRRFVPLLIPVFMTAFRNVHTQSMALEARGFDTRRQRTFYAAESYDGVDWVVTGLALVVVAGSFVASYLGYGGV